MHLKKKLPAEIHYSKEIADVALNENCHCGTVEKKITVILELYTTKQTFKFPANSFFFSLHSKQNLSIFSFSVFLIAYTSS